MRRFFFSLFMVLSIAPLCDAQNLMPQPNKKGLWGYVNDKGKYIIKPIYQAAEPFSSNLACVRINGNYGYINQTGQFAISAVYDRAESFNGDLAKCSKDGKYGLIDKSGAEYLDFEYDVLKLSKNKKYYEGKRQGDNRTFIIAILSGSPIVNAYDEVSDTYSNGYAYVKSHNLYGYIDMEGKVLLSPSFLELPQFTPNNVAISHKESGFGIIDSSLKNIILEQFTYVQRAENGNYHYGNAANSFGIISASGKILIREGLYREIDTIEGSLYLAKDQQEKYNVIDKDGLIILSGCDNLSVSNSIATYTSHGETGKVNLKNGCRAITVKGKEIWTASSATKILYEEPFILWVDSNGNEHRMTETGTAVFEGYSKVELLSKGYYSLKKGEQYAIANTSGKLITDWVDGIIPILEDYVQIIKSVGYGRTNCAIFRTTTGKMITGYDFSWVYTPKPGGLVPVKLLRGDSLSRTEKLLKMMGDSFYIVGDLSEGFYPITDSKTKKMGVMTENGIILVFPKYDEVDEFHNGMCRVWIAEKGNGFINTSGSLVIACQYPQVLNFGTIEGVKSYTQVWNEWGQTYYIDKKGNMVDPDKVLREAYDSQRQNTWY